MYLFSGIMNILAAVILFVVGARDMNGIIYHIPAIFCMIAGFNLIIKRNRIDK